MTDFDPYRAFALTLVAAAVQEARGNVASRHGQHRDRACRDAWRWLRGADWAELCAVLGLDHEAVLEAAAQCTPLAHA